MCSCLRWVWVSTKIHGRTQYDALGNIDVPSVATANTIACRTALLLLLAESLGVQWVVTLLRED